MGLPVRGRQSRHRCLLGSVGTDDPITSADNTAGLDENWTLIAAGDVNLPEERLTVGPAVSFENDTTYTSYKLIFTDTSGAGLMQVADVTFHLFADGLGPNILSPDDAILAVEMGWQSSYLAAEGPAYCLDNDPNTKYLNFGKTFSGFIVTPLVGPSVLDSFQVTTANDHPQRDPVVWMVYGTNDEIVTVDNGDGSEENWILICSGTMALSEDRFTPGPVYLIANQAEPCTSYKVVFETLKDASDDSMQIADIQLFGVLAPIEDEPEPEPTEQRSPGRNVTRSDRLEKPS